GIKCDFLILAGKEELGAFRIVQAHDDVIQVVGSDFIFPAYHQVQPVRMVQVTAADKDTVIDDGVLNMVATGYRVRKGSAWFVYDRGLSIRMASEGIDNV